MFPDFTSRSADLYERACKVMPGGNTRTSLFWPPYQIYAVSGSGARVIDVDEVERIDFNNNFTALIHGHSHPVILERIRNQLSRLTSVGLSTMAEISLAELLCSRVPSFENIRFANSGTEACMNAIKAARAYTGHPKFAKCEGGYHGTYNAFEVSMNPGPKNWGDRERPASVPESQGTPEGVVADVVVIPYNDPEGAERILSEHAKELAAVIIDPMPVRIGMIPATRAFLDMVRQFTRRNGSL
ncbi:MAG: aminotransferase class III-fold pyridoxal phosphate-dependent enzyme, partial [Candidatus Hydrogenedentota bacterium]